MESVTSNITTLLLIHIATLALGFAALFAATVVALGFLIQDRELKLKRFSFFTRSLPAIQKLDRLMTRCLLAGFPFMTVGLILGMVLAHEQWQAMWLKDPIVLFTLTCWAWYAVLLFLRVLFGLRGRQFSWMNVFGFVIVLFVVLGSKFLFHPVSHTPF